MDPRNMFLTINVWYATSKHTTPHTDIQALCSSTRDLFPNRTFDQFYFIWLSWKKSSVFVIVYTASTHAFLQASFCSGRMSLRTTYFAYNFMLLVIEKTFQSPASGSTPPELCFSSALTYFWWWTPADAFICDHPLARLHVSQHSGWEEHSRKHSCTGRAGKNLTARGSGYKPHKYIPPNPNYPQLNFPFHYIQKCP